MPSLQNIFEQVAFSPKLTSAEWNMKEPPLIFYRRRKSLRDILARATTLKDQRLGESIIFQKLTCKKLQKYLQENGNATSKWKFPKTAIIHICTLSKMTKNQGDLLAQSCETWSFPKKLHHSVQKESECLIVWD